MKAQRVTIQTLKQMKERGEKIAVLTAYDATFARLFDESGVDALARADAGAYAMVREAMPSDIAREITASLDIPTIGIGGGLDCDGQVLVSYDMLGMDETFKPRFVRRFATLGKTIKDATAAYV